MSQVSSSSSRRKNFGARHLKTQGGLFSAWQPLYSEHGIPTFPVRVVNGQKKPAIKAWQQVGLTGSAELSIKFPDTDAFGFCPGPRTRLTILDIDTDDERVLADALGKHGKTPIIIRTGSGKFHAWYRNNGERRLIRPFVGIPIDVLGSGFVVAPPSKGTKSDYQIIEGSLDDLDRLPLMCNLDISSATLAIEGRVDKPVTEGRRNRTLWEHCMREAHYCDDLDTLIDVARTLTEEFSPPLDDHEVMKIAKSAWDYTERGENRFGTFGAFVPVSEANHLSTNDQDLLILLVFLRANNGPNRHFMIADALHERLGWTRKRLASARRRLLGTYVEVVRRPSKRNGAGLYRWRAKTGQN